MRKDAFQLDETGDEPFRVVRTDDKGNVVGDFTFSEDEVGDVRVEVRRFDEAHFGSLEIVLP
jgi:hypothetical protein